MWDPSAPLQQLPVGLSLFPDKILLYRVLEFPRQWCVSDKGYCRKQTSR